VVGYIRPNPAFEPWFEHRVIGSEVHYITEAVAMDARRGCPVDQGDLVESIGTTYHDGGKVGRVWVGTDHWQPTEYGAEPHLIRIRNKKVLYNHETDEFFGPEVHHPGNAAQPFMRPALFRRRRLPRVAA